ncbi:MAG: pyroglutamyl-peptidase I [Clostridia bacterium]|nr:pyroglutamyl-peptidase I [Clostridia bacterium]
MKILLTAFEPFGGDQVNPAQEAVALVANEISGAQIVKIDVPVVFGKAIETVRAAMEKEQPDAVLCIGQAGGRFGLTPERVAINVDDGRIPDNEGNQPVDQPVFADGAPAYFSTLPVKAMVTAIKNAGLPASLSNSAGTYVCNHLMYGVLYHINKSWPAMRGGFMHVPFLHEQVMNRPNTPSLSKEDIVRGIEASLRAIVEKQTDDQTAMGAEH